MIVWCDSFRIEISSTPDYHSTNGQHVGRAVVSMQTEQIYLDRADL